jgi:hypothetical protein
MELMAPRVFVRERGNKIRSEAATGSFTGAAAGAAGGGVVCASVDTPQAARNKTTEIVFT